MTDAAAAIAGIEPVGVGFALHPDAEYLGLCRGIIENDAEFFEIAPESLWLPAADGTLAPSPWADMIADLCARSGKPVVGHGLGLSPGHAGDDEPRLARWLEAIARDQRRFGFRWYTEHLGWITAAGLEAVLPLPLPPTAEAARTTAARLARLQPIIPVVGFENQVSYFSFGDPRQEAGFWNSICAAGDLWLLLDLHNVFTQCQNMAVPMAEYLADLDLSRVIEIHLSGGSESEAAWLPSGRVLRIDSHDGPVPEPVWEAFAALRPKCPNLKGVVVERLNGTLEPADVPPLAAEVRRARQIFWEG